jgi:serine/threonine protein phosphatase PrpC
VSEQQEAEHQEPGVSDGEEGAAAAHVPAAGSEPQEPGEDGGAATGEVDVTDSGMPEEPAAHLDTAEIGEGDRPARELSGARRSAAWASPALDVSPAGPTLSFGFNLAKVPGQGEDSDPIVRDGRELGLVAVFDGMGGAGGTVYQTPDGPRTGAYLASRVARDIVEERMLALLDPEWNLDGPAAARDLTRSVKRALADTLTELNAPTSGLRSRLLRALPTTMALMALQRREPRTGRWAGHVFWSGDSRVYVFDPATGAHQLTRDDLRDRGDALVNLRQDSVVSNAMSADVDFVIHHHQVELTTPFVAVAATDGCFGYLRTPIHFEHLVLAALRDSTEAESWSRLIQQRIAAITGDDATMAVLGVGADHEEFRQLFATRTAQIEQRCVVPLDQLESEVVHAEQAVAEARRRRAALQTSLWAAYKPEYERYLGREEDK